jgi:hypothetical protein
MSVFHNNALIGSGGGAAAAAAGGATKSLRFNNDHGAHLKRTPSSAGNRRTFTFSCWVKRSTLGSSLMRRFFSAGATSVSSGNVTLAFYQDQLFFQISSSSNRIISSQVFRDIASFYHIVLAVDTTAATASDRVKIYVNGSQVTEFGTENYPSQNTDTAVNNTEQQLIGCGVDSGGTVPDGAFDGYIADCFLIDGSALDPTSFGAYDDNGVWQAAAYTGTFGTNGFHLLDFENESTIGHDSSGNENDFTALNFLAAQNQYLGDITGTQRSGFNWVQMFDGDLNNGAVPAISSSFTFSPSPTIPFSTLQVYAYKDSSPGTLKINGTDVSSQLPNHNGIGPNQLTTITGISSPLTSIQNISNGSLANVVLAGVVIDGELLLDKASEVDVLFDVPTNGDQTDTGAGGEVSGNYCTINPLSIPSQSVTVSNGNLDHTGAGTNVARVGTIAIPSSGKWYWEVTCNKGGSGAWLLGINGDTMSQALRLAYVSDARKYTDAGGGFSSYGASFTSGDVIGVAVDMDADTLTFYKNGSTQGTAFTSISSGYSNIFPYFQTEQSGRGLSVNFGQRAWAYSAPSNHKALCTTNLPTPTIADGSAYFDVDTYAGTGSSHERSEFSFSPDWVWIKSRTSTNGHNIYDVVRGANKYLSSHLNAAEGTATNELMSFDSDGFTLGGAAGVNGSSNNYVAWAWDAGSSTVSNTDGSITSSVRANASAGFSIVTYTGSSSGSTVGHGLNAAPEFIIGKRRDGTSEWSCYHKSLGNDKAIILNTTAAAGSSSTWNSTTPSSSVVTLGSAHSVNFSSYTHVLYCFAPVAGYSAFGSYTGNGSNDGPFIYTGFKPAFLMLKRTDGTAAWYMYDYKRDGYNAANKLLYANYSNAEANNSIPDLLSNGFKLRSLGTVANGNGNDYIYMAFAENPFQANGGLAR